MAGYSGTPLAQKLGIKPGHVVAVLNEPAGGPITPVVPDTATVKTALRGSVDVAVAFFINHHKLVARLPALGRAIAPDGMVWIVWPKKASGVKTDITEDTIRDGCLPLGLVDVKVCAVDDTWSGLKLVWRKELRRG